MCITRARLVDARKVLPKVQDVWHAGSSLAAWQWQSVALVSCMGTDRGVLASCVGILPLQPCQTAVRTAYLGQQASLQPVRKQPFPRKGLVLPCPLFRRKPKPLAQTANAGRQAVLHVTAVALQVQAKPITQPRVVDFGKGLGRKSVWLYHLPEVESTHKYMRVPNVSARFGTDPSECFCC